MSKTRPTENMNDTLSTELTALHQYQVRAGVLDGCGLSLFATQKQIQEPEEGNIGVRTLFEPIALDEEQHMSWLELRLDILNRMGEPTVIAKHMPSPVQASPQE